MSVNPYMAGSAKDVVAKLLLGHWMVFDHQWGRTGTDPGMWVAIVRAACETEGVPVSFLTIARHDLTVVMNPRRKPSAAQVEESVQAMLRHRFTGRPIPSEMAAKTRHRLLLPR
ncbi:hypothetical protein AB0N89_27785 [Amycolatopsis sp. NPDC089917]|uniref:hypothetical protein n=1 Tax=Amycolatopsis sp. NPDC089917 TaxID=3155187 RepID=UPI00341DBE9E